MKAKRLLNAHEQVLSLVRDGVEVYRHPKSPEASFTLKAAERRARAEPRSKWDAVVMLPFVRKGEVLATLTQVQLRPRLVQRIGRNSWPIAENA